jgi:uncharacterized protein
MSIELRPLNVLCNIQCHYCYQHPQRDAASPSNEYDMVKMKEALEAEGGAFTLFGGEPLLMPLRDLEELWRWGYARFGRNQIQTNAILINDEHITLFRNYAVHVGISMDGPAELNDVRWHGNLENTRKSTEKSQAAIERLCKEGLYPSLIITLHRGNATEERLPRLLDWLRALEECGVREINLHLLESENPLIRSLYGLTTEENVKALLAFYELSREVPAFRFELFPGMKRLLVGDDRSTTCVWYACDPYTTRAVRGVEGQGQRSNCGRTNKDGIDFVKAATPGFERYIALYQTPQEDGGCQGCRFFMMCKGQCPGTSLDGDWRNRTEHCEVWKALFETLENDLIAQGTTPLSLSPLRSEVEQYAIARWRAGREVSMSSSPWLSHEFPQHHQGTATSKLTTSIAQQEQIR